MPLFEEKLYTKIVNLFYIDFYGILLIDLSSIFHI
jgi:hypothetical protein